MFDSFLRSYLLFFLLLLSYHPVPISLLGLRYCSCKRKDRKRERDRFIQTSRNAFERMSEKYIIKIKLQTRVHIIPKLITSRGPCAPLFVLSSHRRPHTLPRPAFTNESKRLKVFWCATQSIVRFPMTMILIDSATKGIRLRLCDLSSRWNGERWN